MSRLFDKNKLESKLAEIHTHFEDELKKISVGKANPEVISELEVEAYGASTPIQSVGQVIVEDAVTVKIALWDRSVISTVEKSLREMNLGASVIVEGENIRLKYNPITEEDRKVRVKEVNDLLENYRIRVRQARQDVMQKLESLDGVSEDQVERDKETVQEMIDNATKTLEEKATTKEKNLMSL